MPRHGLLVEYEYCTGCYACEIACKQEHNYPAGTVGIKVNEVIAETPGKVSVDYIPLLTRFCDLCAERTHGGNTPACVKHCQSLCLLYGPVTELAKEMENRPRSAIIAPR